MMRILLSCAVVFLSLAASPASWAGSGKFAYVDVQQALAESNAAKRAREVLKEKLASKQKEVDVMESDIKQMKDNLEKRQSLMTAEARNELTEKIRLKFRAYQRLVEDNQAAIDRENKVWTKKITDALREVIEEMGKEKGFDAVFGKGQVLFANDAIDITSAVIERLNSRTKEGF